MTSCLATATALTEKLFHGTISQHDYDAQILPTSIKSITRAASIPIIMTTHDTLTAILALAVRGLDVPSPNRERAKPYLWCSTRLLEFIDTPAPMSNEFVLLDQEGLKELFTFLKEGDRTERLLVACEGDVEEGEDLKMLVSREEDREDDTVAVKGWRRTASSEGRRGRELWSEVERSAQNFLNGCSGV